MEQLSRSVSTESSRSWTTPQLLASSSSSPASRKARESVPEIDRSDGNRASVSMPPPASKSIARAFPSRRPSKASDSFDHVSFAKSGSAIDEVDTTPTLEAARGSLASSSQTLTPLPDSAYRPPRSDTDADSHRMSFSSLYSIGSTIYNNARGLSGPSSISAGSEPEARIEAATQGTTTATSSLSITTSSQNGSLGPKVSPTQLLFPHDQTTPSGLPPAPQTAPMPISTSPQLAQSQPPTSNPQDTARRSRSRTTAQRRISGSTAPSSSPGSRGMAERKPTKGIIGVCALESKARSKPARNIFGKLVEDFEVKIFGDKIILDEEVENWPVCDFLISFFSDGFPLDKAIAYVRLRKPFCVNDLPMQQVLWDRRLCLQILDKLNVPTPKRVEVSRDGGPKLKSPEFAKALYDRTGVSLPGPSDGTGGGLAPPQKVEITDDGNTIRVDGATLTKPFVEKPTSGEDHNIHIYFHKKDGGGGRRLFRKVNNKSSEKDDTLDVPRSITDPSSSYIYEQFLQVQNAEDVKAYTVGPKFCHAETRKSPVVDGLVKRNPSGKEVRYVTKLSDVEATIAAKIAEGFGQRVCGFDLLRTGERSYVIDVNGWSFVKDNRDYYDRAADILKDMFLKEVQRKERKEHSVPPEGIEGTEKPPTNSRKNTSNHRQALKGIFKSPSMTKLSSHHPHIPHILGGHNSGPVPSSPEASLSTTPITASPSFEKPYGSAMSGFPSVPKSETDLLLPPSARDKELELAVQGGSLSDDQVNANVNVPAPASKAQWKLKGVVSVVRHADRTPKQKFKYTFHTKPFVGLLKGHQEEVLLIGEAALRSVSDAVKLALKEGVEDMKKLRELQIYLNKKGAWPGTKVQIKPMFRKRRKEELPPGEHAEDSPERHRAGSSSADHHPTDNPLEAAQKRTDSMSGVTFSRISAAENNLVLDKLQLVIKWGGEPTHSARHQAQDMGANFRNDLLLMNREVLDDMAIFSSSERRSTTSAQIFGASFLEKEKYPSESIDIRKDLLDDSNAAKDVMDKVKKKLKTLLRAGDKAPPQFAWPDDAEEPYIVVRQVVDLMKFHQRVMNYNFKKIESGAVSSLSAIAGAPGDNSTGQISNALSQVTNVNNIQSRWCCNEGPELFKERWEKLFKEFGDADKVDPSKISELYDSMKFDALHNRQFLEWVFTPDPRFLEEDPISDSSSKRSSDSQSKPQPGPSEAQAKSEQSNTAERPPERASVAQRMGFRRRSEIITKPAPVAQQPQDSYFKLYTGLGNSASKALTDARLSKLREMYKLCKVLFDYIGPQEYGIDNEEKLEIGLLTSLPLLREIVEDLEELQASDAPKSFFYFTKESHIYTLLNCIIEGGIETKISRAKIPELDYLSQIGFELYESENVEPGDQPNTFNYSIKITLSPGCHAFAPLDVQLDSRHMIGFSPRRSLTAHLDWRECLETLRAKFHTVKLPKSFVAINISEKIPDAFDRSKSKGKENEEIKKDELQSPPVEFKDMSGNKLPPPALDG
ncbi:histidine phosphatase superfamily-domain-containing protein [Lophiotrema nucula]|uniref:Inositol hexakisphosphate and diphosphoinositol-pentakisphosphate kinase n=1 Tax=Lophiotrema nucula TaxID=690887 RepID=A0A6A5ZAY9_9PLEO|nr:histidine phosphatase superfamily-domain-containing protein [Lophiotrema nucula]